MLGTCFLNSTTPEKGLFYLNRVDSIVHPSADLMASLYRQRQSIYSTLGKFDSAFYCLQKAYEFEPDPKYLFYTASLCRHSLKDKQLAISYYEKFLQALPPKPETETTEKEGFIVVSYRNAAENSIRELKEELFFEAKE